MAANLEVESTLTDRFQTTVPETVRRALRLGKRDKIHYSIRPSGEVVLSRSNNAADADPALGAFLNFLAKDMAKHPEHLVPLTAEMYEDIVAELSGERGVGVDGLPPTLEQLWAQEEEGK